MAATAYFVQFPHPGGENTARTDEVAWNTTDTPHRRKFLLAPGRYLDAADGIGEGELVFWGEWEPPSRIERRWPQQDRLPRTLHRPFWTRPAIAGSWHNTDPWVFGERMLYSNCRQLTGAGRPSALQRLIPGSVICFGSTITGEFCVDTVFVVARCEPWTPAQAAALDVGEAFTMCTAQTTTSSCTTSGCGGAHLPLTLYRGATLDEPIHGTYSFVPARPTDSPDLRFSRPPIHLPGLINPTNRQSTWGSRRALPIASVQHAWAALRHQVLSAGLVLAVHLATPVHQDANMAVR
jgi:hypothetical protein